MGSFDIYTNYNKTAGVSGVVFGANKGVLEVELNEMQEITKHQLRNFIKNIIGNGITDTDKITYKNGRVIIADGCSFVIDGNIINCTGLSIPASNGDTVYLQVWEDTVSFGDTLKVEGNQQESSTVPNWIKDSRGEDETTRRLVLKYTLATSEDQTKTNIKIASIANNTMTLLIGKANTDVEIKDVKEWALFAKLPYILYRGSAIVYNNEIHVLGSNTQHYKWDGTNWVSVSTLPKGFGSGSMVVLNGEIHILGGLDNVTPETDHYKWDGTNWISVSTLPYGFARGSAVVLNGEIHILGGSGGKTNHYKWNGSQWVSVSTLPYDFLEGSAVVLNGEIHILGSSSISDSGNGRRHYKWDGTNWISVSTLPHSFSEGSAVVLNNEIHILGGFSSDSRTVHYKWDGTNWISVSILPHSFYDGSAVVLNNEIHIVIKDNDCFVFHNFDHLFINNQPVNAENILTKEQLSAITYKELTGTLIAGQTSLTFTNTSITSNTIVDNVLTSVYGVTPEDMTISNGSLTLTFDAQASDIGVKVVIR